MRLPSSWQNVGILTKVVGILTKQLAENKKLDKYYNANLPEAESKVIHAAMPQSFGAGRDGLCVKFPMGFFIDKNSL